MKQLRKRLFQAYIAIKKSNSSFILDENSKKIVDVEAFLNMFNKLNTAKAVWSYFNFQNAPLQGDDGLPLDVNEFIEKYCCDLKWAQDGGYCVYEDWGDCVDGKQLTDLKDNKDGSATYKSVSQFPGEIVTIYKDGNRFTTESGKKGTWKCSGGTFVATVGSGGGSTTSGGGGSTSSGGGGTTVAPKPKFKWNEVDYSETDLESCDYVVIKGDRGDIVETIQERLKVWGFKSFSKSGSVDGKFGSMTKKMVQDFQTKVGLSPKGTVGCKTWEKLKENPGPVVPKGQDKPTEDPEPFGDSYQIKMNKRLFISEEEKRRILSTHNSLRETIMGSKFLMREEIITPDQIIPKGIQLGCTFLKGLKRGSNEASGYYKEADADSPVGDYWKKGDFLFLNLPKSIDPKDWTFYVRKLIPTTNQLETTKSKDYRWKCTKLAAEVQGPQNLTLQQWKQNGGWMTYDEAVTAGINMAATNTYTKSTDAPDGKVYYKIGGLASAGVESKDLTPRQKEVVNYYREFLLNKNFQEWKSGDDANTLEQKQFSFVEPPYRRGAAWIKSIVPGSQERGFTGGLTIWVNPNYSNQILDVDLESLTKTAESLEVGFKTCESLVRKYYQMYQQRTRLKATAGICDLKEKLIACKAEHCNPGSNNGRCGGQGGVFRSKDFQNLMDFFSGFEPKGDASGQNTIPASVGRSVWYLPPPDSYDRAQDPNCK